MHIIPALLTNTVTSLFAQYDNLSPYFSYFQIDIANGTFVPNTTVQVSEIIDYLASKPQDYLQSSTFDFHLMVNNYEQEIYKLSKQAKKINIQNVFIHFGVLQNYEDLSHRFSDFAIGIALNPEDSIDTLANSCNLKTTPCIQIMTVSPGFQGSAFLPKMLKKIQQLRKHNYKGSIYLDGGINAQTLPVIAQLPSPPDYLGIGSYLSQAEDIAQRVEHMQQILLQKVTA